MKNYLKLLVKQNKVGELEQKLNSAIDGIRFRFTKTIGQYAILDLIDEKNIRDVVFIN